MKKFYIIIGTLLVVIILAVTVYFAKSEKPQKISLVNDIENKTAVISTENEYKLATYITDEIEKKAENGTVMAEHKKPYTPEYMDELADNIAIIRVISLDGASAQYDDMVGMTYGKMVINNILKGDLEEGKVVEYLKPGGIVNIAEWEKYQPQEANEKRDYLRAENGIKIDKEKEYYNLKMENDIDIEEGKTYLAYLKYHKSSGKYEIIGLENGLREVNIPKENEKIQKIKININELEIKNNETQKFEPLQKYVTNNIKK